MNHRDGSRPTLRTFDPEAGIRVPVNASSRGGVWRTIRPKCRLPKSPCLAPSSCRLLRHLRWRQAGCVPLRIFAKFEQRVLYGRGPAQVGFGVLLSSFHYLTLSSGGILSPEPLRLTRPVGAIFHEDDLPKEWKEFAALNAEMAPQCPVIKEKRTPLAKQ